MHPMRVWGRGLVKNIIYLLIAVIFVLLYFRYIERRTIYFPMKDIEITPDAVGLKYEDVYFETLDGIKLNGWFLPAQNSRFTLILCHGNAGNISHRIEKLQILQQLDLSIFIFDYRGYGRSQGRPSETGLYRDAEAAYNYLVSARKIEPQNIIVYGESLGGAVAIDLASKKNIKALITEGTFSSTRDVARIVYPFLPSFLVSSSFDSARKIRGVRAPKLIVHSINDEIIPFRLSNVLFEAAHEPKRFLKLMGGHNTAFLDSENLYRSGIADFLTWLDLAD